ncbi:carboxypeptidase regulatory-like domain-containing protein [Paenibacillus sp. J5C_2022]|uniref:heparin/heparin-sulfate lyase HepB n=1 Tax=Paenibacillus sp. J5C2022 TaxID=2977129 RepID=UPI0021CF5F75|nr:heparin/heparin-sulfate lyase HepB [Paenibacillus sp. J5C2022]MCU6712490.1 carboxypeptidase regulatory-like domain-containing protein [Paenibacillus sp. J5C2022]
MIPSIKRNGVWKLTLAMLLIVQLLAVSPARSVEASGGGGLIGNGGFEAGLSGWNQNYGSGGIAVSDEQAFEGAYSLKITDASSTASYGMESDKFPAYPGKSYSVTSQVYMVSGYASVMLRFYNDANGLVESNSIPRSTPQDAWQSADVSAIAPAGTTKVSVLFYSSLATMAEYYVDGVSLHERTLLEGTVTDDASGSPLGDAGVFLHEAADTGYAAPLETTVSAADGSYQFIGGVTDGSYVIRFVKEGYLDAVMPVTVGSAVVTPIDAALQADPAWEAVSLLPNGSFEAGLAHWEQSFGSGGIALDGTRSTAGRYSVRIDDVNPSASYGLESDRLTAYGGKNYTAAAKVLVESGGASLYIRFYDAAGNLLLSTAAQQKSASAEWVPLVHSSEAPAGTATVSVLLYSGQSALGTYYADELMLEERSIIRGAVGDAGSGDPLPFTKLYLYDEADTAYATPLDSAVTEGDGTYALTDGVSGGSYVLRARLPGYETATVPIAVSQSELGPVDVALSEDLQAQKWNIAGTALSFEGGTPVAGATAKLYHMADIHFAMPISTAVSDAAGAFSFPDAQPDGRYQVQVESSGRYKTTHPAIVYGAAADDLTVRMPEKTVYTESALPVPPASHPRLYVTPSLVPQLQAKIATAEFEPIWEDVQRKGAVSEYNMRSSGTTAGFENYSFPSAVNARYVRIVGSHNSNSGPWNSIIETAIFGEDNAGQRTALPIQAVDWSSAQDEWHDGYRTVDGDLSSSSYWAAFGAGEWVQYDLGSVTTVTDMDIAWYQGNQRYQYFDIRVSNDGITWDKIPFNFPVPPPGELETAQQGQSNYKAFWLSHAEAAALRYLLEGSSEHGLQAIEVMRNFMSTVQYEGEQAYFYIGKTIHTAALVYDWCYPLLTALDKTFFVEKSKELAALMSVGYPPVKQGNVVGHGSEFQVMRDQLGMGIAVYDEDPEMYNLAALRFFNEYVPVRNFWYQSGMHHQGDTYGLQGRFEPELWAQWMFQRMGYGSVLSEKQADLIYRAIYTRRPDGQLLRDGDTYWDRRYKPDQYWQYSFAITMAAGYYQDPYIQDEFLRQYQQGGVDSVTAVLFADFTIPSQPVSQLPLTRYFGYPSGTMMARTGWDQGYESNTVVAEMKGGEYYYTNHQHLDMGSFQVYHKGALALDSGMYKGQYGPYGSDHDFHYYKKTIAHNAMLVMDPSEKPPTSRKFVNDGGQRLPYTGQSSEVKTLEGLLDSDLHMGVIKAHAYGPDASAPAFSYMQADLSAAYSDKVQQYQRSYAFINTGDANVPGAMIVYDRIASADPHFKKYWLLHAMEEPEISGSRVTIRRTDGQYDGKLINDALLPGSGNLTIEKIGGPGREFEVFGTNYPQTPYEAPGQHTVEGGAWRVQLSPNVASEEDAFLNVMQFMDNDVTAPLAVTAIDAEQLLGARIGDHAVLFNRQAGRTSETLSFQLPGSSPASVAVTGLEAGSWLIHRTGQSELVLAQSTEEGGMITFQGESGEYILTPMGELQFGSVLDVLLEAGILDHPVSEKWRMKWEVIESMKANGRMSMAIAQLERLAEQLNHPELPQLVASSVLDVLKKAAVETIEDWYNNE